MSDNPKRPSNTPGRRGAYERALISEIRMLVDYIASSPTQNMDSLTVQDTLEPYAELPIRQILVRIDQIKAKLDDEPAVPQVGSPITPDESAFLQIVRDALNRAVRPASGLSVAYTALVTGSRRGPKAESRETLAREAYAGIVSTALFHRYTQILFLLVAVFVTFFAVRESAKVALGRSHMQNLDTLRTQQAAISLEKTRLEAMLDKAVESPELLLETNDPTRLRMQAFFLCDRGLALSDYLSRQTPAILVPTHGGSDKSPLKLNTNVQERDVCGRDSILGVNFTIVHSVLKNYVNDWPEMNRSFAEIAAQLIPSAQANTNALAKCPPADDKTGTPATSNVNCLAKDQEDVEYIIAPMLLVWGNYILPVIFGLLGSFIFVILDFYGKVRESRLDPRDYRLSWVRLVLGLVTGACIGLFYSASVPAQAGPTQNLVAALSLSASGIAFLAGFGVEGVFSMLQQVVSRVFVDSSQK